MNRLIAVAIWSVGLLSLMGCTGYPDGPAVSLSAAEEKLLNTWVIEEAERNGMDVTDAYREDFFRFEAEGAFARQEGRFVVDVPPGASQVGEKLGRGEWVFRNEGTQVELLYQFRFDDPSNPSVEYLRNINELWDIRRLSRQELWLADDSTTLKMVLR
jgi:hypothetical protein